MSKKIGPRPGSPDSPDVLLELVSARGIRLAGLPIEKVERRLRACVRQGYLSDRQRQILHAHLLE